MSDLAVFPAGHALPKAVSDLTRARHRAERRFRMYGLSAILLTGLFLALVLADILVKGLPAFSEHRSNFAIVAEPAVLDPNGARNRLDLLAGDYKSLVRQALRAEFPAVESRAGRSLLNGLLSSGAEDDFRRMVSNNPALLGQKLAVPALLSDDADQYLKGNQTKAVRHAGRGGLTLVEAGENVVLTAQPGEFAPLMEVVRRFVGQRLSGIEIERRRLEVALGNNAKEAAESLQTQIDALKAQIDDLRSIMDSGVGAIDLGPRRPAILIDVNGGTLRALSVSDTVILGEALVPLRSTEAANAGDWSALLISTAEADRRVSDQEIAWLETLKARGLVERAFAFRLFTSGDSREPELAGLRGALIGSFLTLAVTLALALPLGVGAAIYLEEFAPKNRWTELIEININNLAAVPSIVFGLLGLAIFLNAFGLPRSAPIVGGLVLALLVLPTIIIASRAAIKAVPPSIKEAALGVGASHQQAVFHHVLPLAMPGIMTGAIIGMAHALGETAPLLMIGMIAFIVDVPGSVTDAATVLPVQIYLWSDLPEAAFQAKTAATIIVLLLFLFIMNAFAILLRRSFERRW